MNYLSLNHETTTNTQDHENSTILQVTVSQGENTKG